MNLIEYPDSDLMMMELADELASALKSSLLTHERTTFAVPGGTTPGPAFDILSAVNLDWARVTVVPTDERCVPDTHDRSNARLIRERLLTDAAAPAMLQPLFASDEAPDAAAERMSEVIAPLLPLNVLLLGMGEDMHIASLFPGAEGLARALSPASPPVVATHPEAQPEARLTLSGPALAGALNTHIVITGPAKRAALEKAQKLQPIDAPVQVVLTNATIHWAP